MAMRRESNERMADFAVADVSLFWLLNALNSAEPVLGYFLRYRQSPPERLYPELARLAGSLLTFSLTHQANAVPIYQHDQLNAVFPPLFDLLSDLLEASLPSRVVAIALEHDARLHFWQARLHDARLREGADYYLSVRSSVPFAQLQEQFPRQCKVGSPDHVKAIVNSSRTGCPSRHCVMCRRRSRCVWKISISASMCPTPWRRKCCRAAPVCFTSRGCSVSLNLNFLRYYERE